MLQCNKYEVKREYEPKSKGNPLNPFSVYQDCTDLMLLFDYVEGK